MKTRNLTPLYSLTNFLYWAAYTGTVSFASVYLLSLGMAPGIVGGLLAAAGLLSCVTQPILASFADRASKFILIRLLIVLSGVCFVSFGLQLIPGLPYFVVGMCYLIGVWTSDATIPLLNALSIAYSQAEYPVNFGISRGIGAIASAVAALALGSLIARFGNGSMIAFLAALRLGVVLSLLAYPRISKSAAVQTAQSCSTWQFFRRYRWYCLSTLGVLFLGMFHAMSENYLIAVMERLGGGSREVGIALFIVCMAAFPVITCFSKIREKIPDNRILQIAAVSYICKAVLLLLAPSVTSVYFIQLLQLTTYGFLCPVQVYYAGSKVRREDLVKGQAFITAAYALGCSAGNLAGGVLLNWGVTAMLTAGIGMTLVGTILIFATVNKQDKEGFYA